MIALFNGIFVLGIAASAGEARLREQIGATALFGIVVGTVLVAAIALCAMWLLPHRGRHPRELLPGALLVAVGHQLVQLVVLFYFAPRLGDAEETYGAFGTAATTLVWLYVPQPPRHRGSVSQRHAVGATSGKGPGSGFSLTQGGALRARHARN